MNKKQNQNIRAMDERYIVAIDLGTSKFALTVAKIEGENIHIIYYKETPAEGVRWSRVFIPAKVETVLKEAIAEAENELGIKITQVVVGMPKSDVVQELAQLTTPRNDDECITVEEIGNLKEMAIDTYPLDNPENEALYGAIAQSFSNGEEFQLVEDDIIGMTGNEIEGNFKLFIGRRRSLTNIDLAFKNTGVCVARKYFTPESTAKAVLSDSEMDNGVALIDFGAGVTSVSIYHSNVMRHYAAIPFGGSIITKDIKSELQISERLAEQIKLGFGACMPDKLLTLGEKTLRIASGATSSAFNQVSVKYLSEIITARTREIIEAVLYEIQKSGLADKLKNGIVVTGGCAEMTNCSNLIQEMSGYTVRTGYPRKLFSTTGCDGIFESSAAVSVGMILTGKQEKGLNCLMPAEAVHETHVETDSEFGTIGKADEEIRENNNGELFSNDEIGDATVPKPERKQENKKPKHQKPGFWTKLHDATTKTVEKVGTLFNDAYDNLNENINSDQL